MTSLDSLYSTQAGWMVQFQNFLGPGVTPFFRIVSALGEDVGYLILLSALWAGVSRKSAARITLLLLISFYLNSFLKEGLAQPRPFQAYPVPALGDASGPGIPSGHAQSSLLFWGLMMHFFPAPWVRALGGVIIGLMALSRVYLGVHFPTDILGGWGVASVLLLGYLRLGERCAAGWARIEPRMWIRSSALLCALGLALHPTPTAAAALGALFGVVSGLALEAVRGGGAVSLPEEGRSIGVRVRSIFLAWAGAAVLYLGLKAVFPGEGAQGYLFFRLARYALIGLWVSYGAQAASAAWKKRG